MGRVATGVCVVIITFVLAASSSAQESSGWRPVEAAELALKAPKVEADADAEALFWDVRVADVQSATGEFRTVFDHYVRIKIFTERGRSAYATVDISHDDGSDVINVAARTVKADGSIVELKNSDIFKRTTVKADDVREMVVSFAAPALEPGAILEYRWREIVGDSLSDELRLPFSRELPVQQTRYYVRPLDDDALEMKAIAFNGAMTPFARQRDGFFMSTLSNVRADRDEPYAFPLYERTPWMLLYYDVVGSPSVKDPWRAYSQALHDSHGPVTRANDDIRRLAQGIPQGPVAERAPAIMRAILQRVKRVDADAASAADRRAVLENNNAADVLKRGLADGTDMIRLFLAVAKSAGLDARVAAVPNRQFSFLKQDYDHPFFRRGRIVALRDGANWVFLDPANEHSADGSLRWYYAGASALIADAKTVITAQTPAATADQSRRERNGTFTLREDGTLEGEVRLAYTGHIGESLRERDDQDAPEEQARTLRELFTTRWPGAEITNVKIEHLANPGLPYTQAFTVRIPGYAQRTGTRLLFQPAVFQKGVDAMFTAATRRGGIDFRYPWTDRDNITIDLPAGFELEQPEAPQGANVGAVRYDISLGRQGNTRVSLTRALAIGVNRALVFEASGYAGVKQLFDYIHTSDAHTLVLRRQAAQ